jgi:hypothetical protein
MDKMKLNKVVSGGQTGVDRGALDAAIETGISHGGWCPKGRLAEDGGIDSKYDLKETESSEASERTKLNIRDSDGTLVILPRLGVNITDGTGLTLKEVQEKKKPYFVFFLFSPHQDVTPILNWLEGEKIKALNIAGPRESKSPGIYLKSVEFLKQLFKALDD